MTEIQNEKIDSYINEVCSEVRFREAHQEIEMELKNHIEEMMEEYMAEGFSQDDSLIKAIDHMGDAALVGKQLDKAHKPKPDWSILGLGLIFAGFGLIIQFFMGRQDLFGSSADPFSFFSKTLIFLITGALIAAGLYRFDYRKTEQYAIHIYLGTMTLMFLTMAFGRPVNGHFFLDLKLVQLDIVGISPLLFSIALAGIFNNRDWRDFKKAFQALVLCLIPLFLILAGNSLSTALIYAVVVVILMIASGAGRKIYLFLSLSLTGSLVISLFSAPYRLERLLAFMNPAKDPSGSGWLDLQLRTLFERSGFWGQGFTLKPNSIPNLHTDFIFSYISFTFGWIAAVVLAALIVFFLIRAARIAGKIKNNYGKLLVTGFISILTVQFLWNILMNLGLAPISGVSLPFISFGGSQLVFNAALLGIISNIYKLRNISITRQA